MKSPGFTLAELLVSIGVLILFTAILIPGFSSFGRRNELHQAAQLVRTKIFETKAYALAPRSQGGQPITAYRFVAPSFSAGCSGFDRFAIIELTGSEGLVECGLLPFGVVFEGGTTSVTFSVEGQGAITAPPTSPITYTIHHSRLTPPNHRSIMITRATGQVTVSNPF